MIDPVLVLSIRLGLAALLFAAAWHKLREFEHFAATVAGYRLLPAALAGPVAVLLVCIECALAICLLLAFSPAVGAGVALLLSLYALAITVNLLRGRADIDCGCTGPAAGRSGLSWGLVGRNACLVIVALLAALPVTGRSLSVLDVATVAATVVCAGFIYLALDLSLRHGQRARRYERTRRSMAGES